MGFFEQSNNRLKWDFGSGSSTGDYPILITQISMRFAYCDGGKTSSPSLLVNATRRFTCFDVTQWVAVQ